MHDRSSFLSLSTLISVNHCGVSPVIKEAVQAAEEALQAQAIHGSAGLGPGRKGLELFRNASAHLLRTDPDNISFIPNSALGLNVIAHGFPFKEGDEILSYRHEYPSNHYPWKLQENRGVKLVEMEGTLFEGSPLKWELDELRDLITPRTRMVAISHVQFTSGFAADLAAIGSLCKERGIILVVDAAQSIGSMPMYPEQLGIDAIVTSGWKWLLGPIGSGMMYTTPQLRAQLRDVIVGPDTMKQGINYLDHTFNPHQTGVRFEYSTLPYPLVAALGAAIDTLTRSYGIEYIWERIRTLQSIFLSEINTDLFHLAPLHPSERAGILSFTVAGDVDVIIRNLESRRIQATARGPYGGKLFIRCAPHFYLHDDEIREVARAFNSAAS